MIENDLKPGNIVINKITGDIGKVFDCDEELDSILVHIDDFIFEKWSIKDVENYFNNDQLIFKKYLNP